MTMSPDQRRMMQVASGFGYKVNEGAQTKIVEFEPGDPAIVFTTKGEPIMSGAVEEIEDPTEYSGGSLRIGDQWYDASTYFFRRA
jgi:hypothetical protein